MIPAGETARVLSGPCPDDRRLVDVLWGNRNLIIFVQDLESRGEEIQVPKKGLEVNGIPSA